MCPTKTHLKSADKAVPKHSRSPTLSNPKRHHTLPRKVDICPERWIFIQNGGYLPRRRIFVSLVWASAHAGPVTRSPESWGAPWQSQTEPILWQAQGEPCLADGQLRFALLGGKKLSLPPHRAQQLFGASPPQKSPRLKHFPGFF